MAHAASVKSVFQIPHATRGKLIPGQMPTTGSIARSTRRAKADTDKMKSVQGLH